MTTASGRSSSRVTPSKSSKAGFGTKSDALKFSRLEPGRCSVRRAEQLAEICLETETGELVGYQIAERRTSRSSTNAHGQAGRTHRRDCLSRAGNRLVSFEQHSV